MAKPSRGRTKDSLAVLYPSERARLLRQHADTLEHLFVALARSPHRTADLPSPLIAVGYFVNALLAKITQADGYRTGGELALAEQYFRDGADLRDNDEWVRNVRDVDTHLMSIRPFVAVAKAHDQFEGTAFVRQISFVVGDMAALIVTSDGHTAAGEGKLVAELMNDILAPPLDA